MTLHIAAVPVPARKRGGLREAKAAGSGDAELGAVKVRAGLPVCSAFKEVKVDGAGTNCSPRCYMNGTHMPELALSVHRPAASCNSHSLHLHLDAKLVRVRQDQ